jgi:hypothetical protein
MATEKINATAPRPRQDGGSGPPAACAKANEAGARR